MSSVATPWCFQTPCLSPGARKAPLLLGNRLVVQLLQLCKSRSQNFRHLTNSFDHLMAGWEQITSPCCPLFTAQEMTPGRMEIHPDSKNNNWAKTVVTVYAQPTLDVILLVFNTQSYIRHWAVFLK